MTGVRIIIDNREPPAMRGLLAAHREVELEVRPLSVANFVIGPGAAAERKTADRREQRETDERALRARPRQD